MYGIVTVLVYKFTVVSGSFIGLSVVGSGVIARVAVSIPIELLSFLDAVRASISFVATIGSLGFIF